MDYKFKIRVAVSEAFRNISLSELIELMQSITKDLVILREGKKLLSDYINNSNPDNSTPLEDK